jgi:hypothetical protein
MTMETADAVTTTRPPPAVAFGGPGTAATEDDYQQLADALGCSITAVHAVAEVETARAPFLADGTGRPSILFEAHVFNRYTNSRFLGAKDRHGVPLATMQGDQALYGAGGAHQYERLEDASALDPDAALMATSWGMFQIMGFNWKEAGFASCKDMVTAMCAGSAAHFVAFRNFIRSKQLEDALRSTPPDFVTFARDCNGRGNVTAYAAKMQSCYATLNAGLADSSPEVTPVTRQAATPAHTSPVTTQRSAKMPDINYGTAFVDAASSAATGMVLGPQGAVIGGLLGFAVDVVPGLFPHLFGKNSTQVQAAVKTAVVDITGGKTSVSDVQAAVAADPAKANEIQQKLMAIAAQADAAQRLADQQQRQADLDQLKVALADTASAREQTDDLVKAGSPLAWGAPIISVLVLITFATVVLVALFADKEATPLLNVVLGTLGTMSTAVVTYCVGSSAGSQQKTALLAKAQPIG